MQITWLQDTQPATGNDNFLTSEQYGDQWKVTLDVIPDDSSYRYRALMAKPTVMLKFSLTEFVEIPVGAWIEFFGQKYYLRCPEDIKKQGTRNIEYTLNLYDRSSELGDYKLRNTVDRRLKFSMCAKPHEFLQLIVDNLNERDGNVWEIGTYIDSNEKTIEFNHVFIDAGLQAIADEFKTEWQISPSETAGKFKVSLGKVELPMPPLPLGYGKGNGFVPGVGRTSKSEEKPVKRLYVQGGERNIDRSKNLPSLYRGTAAKGDTTSATLLLPIGQSIRYDGTHFEGETDFDSNNAREYTVDEDGYSIKRTDMKSSAVKEDSLDLSEIYPKRVGHVTRVRLGTEGSEEYCTENHLYDIVDDSVDMPNYSDYRIKGEDMTIIFQSGMLAGREFEVADYIHEAKGDIPGKRFKITPAEIDGITMPDPETGFFPKEKHGNVGDEDYYSGDEYAVFGVMLPDSYICNNATKTGAAWDMFREAVKYLYEHEDQKFTFTGELQGLWAKRNWGLVGAYMAVGAYILFTDNQFATEGVKIRVVGVKEFLNNPYAPTLEISNEVGASSTVSTQLREADNVEVVIDETKRELQQFTKRRYRDAVETLTALQEAMGDNFSSAINPVTIQTMAALIGDESLQFTFGRKVGDEFVPDKPQIDWNAGTCKISISACWLKHLTLGQNSITTQERRDTVDSKKCPMWEMPQWQTREVGANEDRLYLYAVCPTEGQTTYELRLTPRPLKQDDTYYFLVGILSSEYEGERSFVTVYGFTEILPGRITTNTLVSTDGKTYVDLERSEIGGTIKFITDPEHNTYETIIDGGKIKTNLIDVDNLTSRRVEVYGESDDDRRGVTITPEDRAISIKDETGLECSSIEGRNYDNIGVMLGGVENFGNLTISQRGAACYGYSTGVTLGRGKLAELQGQSESASTYSEQFNLTPMWPTPNPTEITIQGFVDLQASSSQPTNTGGNLGIIQRTPRAEARLEIWLYTYATADGGVPIHSVKLGDFSARASFYTNNAYAHEETIKSFTVKGRAIAGYHRVVVKLYRNATMPTDRCSMQWGNTATGRVDFTGNYKSDFYVSRYFANGFCLGVRSDNYVIGYKDGENGMRFMFANNGNEVDFSKDGLRYRINYGEWKNLT